MAIVNGVEFPDDASQQEIDEFFATESGATPQPSGTPSPDFSGPPSPESEALGEEDPIGTAMAILSGVGAARMAAPALAQPLGRLLGGPIVRGAARRAAPAVARAGGTVGKVVGKYVARQAGGPAFDLLELFGNLVKSNVKPGRGRSVVRPFMRRAAARPRIKPTAEPVAGGPRATHAEAGRPVLAAAKPRGVRSPTNVGIRPVTPRRVTGGPAMEVPGKLMSDLERSLQAEAEIRKLGVSPADRLQLLELLRQAAP